MVAIKRIRKQAMFNNEWYDVEELPNSSTRPFKEKNKNGFKISITFYGDPEENERGLQAMRDFFKYTF
ncbi:hypothetical protein PaeCFBP13512_12840 [Paenibacillus sp. CFBP13512]|uniref:hypothetical protein n=1 Tax=Paenibacillus sp. CFBP13512 TaxID=2184007 RepID=UPI0010C158F9|nr:hypothetical protein [Paenibacillus sp. CFBP13512]TKJ90711.1 hypothetical protein PaeCFBP13512_12840 [Paenibacillus sp. CFBP13512]